MSQPRLVIIRGIDHASFPLQVGQGIIGRAPGSAIELRHPEVSRQHTRIAWDGTTCTVENLSSTRGTTVNGLAIATAVELKPGDELGVGPVFLKLDPYGEPGTKPPPLPASTANLVLVHKMPTDRIELRHGPLTM